MFFAVGIAWLPIIPGVVINMRHPERACIQELRSSKTVVDNINPYYEWTYENEQQIREGGYMFVYCWNLFNIIFSTCTRNCNSLSVIKFLFCSVGSFQKTEYPITDYHVSCLVKVMMHYTGIYWICPPTPYITWITSLHVIV